MAAAQGHSKKGLGSEEGISGTGMPRALCLMGQLTGCRNGHVIEPCNDILLADVLSQRTFALACMHAYGQEQHG